jgi:HEAT repeat protein
MGEDPAVARAARYAAVGQSAEPPVAVLDELEAATIDDPDPRARAAALGALVRVADPERVHAAWTRAAADPDPTVRRRAADLAPGVATPGGIAPAILVDALITLLADGEVSVIEAAAWALGELGESAVVGGAVPALSATVTAHRDALAREAAVAALGALGDPAGLLAVLTGCGDTAAVRRRAVLALAPFDGAEVEAALAAAANDRDWQVRQAAEDLLTPPP